MSLDAVPATYAELRANQRAETRAFLEHHLAAGGGYRPGARSADMEPGGFARMCKAHGLVAPPAAVVRARPQKFSDDDMRAAAAEGLTRKEAAARFGVTICSVYERARKAGVVFVRAANPPPRRQKFSDDDFRAAVAEGLTITEFSGKFRVHKLSVRHREVKLGLRLRRERTWTSRAARAANGGEKSRPTAPAQRVASLHMAAQPVPKPVVRKPQTYAEVAAAERERFRKEWGRHL